MLLSPWLGGLKQALKPSPAYHQGALSVEKCCESVAGEIQDKLKNCVLKSVRHAHGTHLLRLWSITQASQPRSRIPAREEPL